MGRCSYFALVAVVCSAMRGVFSSLPWYPDNTVVDIQVVSGRIGTLTSITLNECMLDCYLTTPCVTIGYNQVNKACQQYSIDLTDFTHNLFGQSNTDFYKVTCPGRPGYVYIRSLHLCIKRYSGQLAAFFDALVTCSNEGASLLELNTANIQDYFLKTLLHVHDTSANSYIYHIGGTYNSTMWVWLDSGAPISSGESAAFWDTNEPNSANGECVGLVASAEEVSIKSVECADDNMFICSYQSYET